MTQTQQKAMECNEKYKRYIETKSDHYVAKRISLAYILFSVANSYCEEANDRLAEYDLVHKKIKTTANNLMQSFDAYDKVLRTLIHPESECNVNHTDVGGQLCEDYDIIKNACDEFMNKED